MGVKKPSTGLRFADVLVIEEGTSTGPPRIETFSFKSRDFSGLEVEDIQPQMIEDAHEALRKYGETLDIRRDTLQSLLRQGHEVKVQRTRLIYEGDAALMPKRTERLPEAVNAAMAKVPKVEVLFQ